jgi:hypothetical protein
MIPVGEYSDTLRALGQYLDRVGAASIEIVAQGQQWLVASGSGCESGSETLFLRYRLEDLCREGRLRRGTQRHHRRIRLPAPADPAHPGPAPGRVESQQFHHSPGARGLPPHGRGARWRNDPNPLPRQDPRAGDRTAPGAGRGFDRGSPQRLDPDRLRHLRPPGVALAFQPSQVDRRHRQRAVIEKSADVLDGLPNVAPEFRSRVAEDVDAGEREIGSLEVASQIPIEGSAGQALRIRRRRPEAVVSRHRPKTHAPRLEGRDDGLVCGL